MTDNSSPDDSALSRVQKRIAAACDAAARSHQAVSLLAVSKTRSAAELHSLIAAGQRAFGENYLQEALEKIHALADQGLEWHFIGPIQSNKTRPIAEHFAWVHSVDRLKIAQRLNDQRPNNMAPLQICLQLNISGEASKSGVSLDELPTLAQAVAALPRLRLRGLMAIPAPSGDPAQQRRPLAAMRQALEGLQRQGLAVDTLSMGMSDDLEVAIAEGATMVRIGTALFGPRRKTHAAND